MTIDKAKNFVKAKLSVGINNTDTTIQLLTGEGSKFEDPSSFGEYNLVLYDSSEFNSPADDPEVEIIRVVGITGDQLTVLRAQEGTTAANHNSAGREYTVEWNMTAGILNEIKALVERSGNGSGLDADLLDGNEGTYYAPAAHTHTLNIPHSLSLKGKLLADDNTYEFVPPLIVPVSKAVKIVGLACKLKSGTSVNFQVHNNGAAITEFGTSGTVTATTTKANETLATPISLSNLDELNISLTSVTGTCYGLSVVLILEYSI